MARREETDKRPRLPGALFFLIGLALPCLGSTQAPSHRAGEVVRVVPVVHIARNSQQLSAAARTPVLWQDVVETARYARARVRLDDGSVLNVGSESSLRIVTHDAPAQRSELELQYGRLRAKVVKLGRPDPLFRIRSPIAVVGVVGTHFWIGQDPDFMDVLCLEGSVWVRSADQSIEGQVTLLGGEMTRVRRGAAPTPPVKASPEQIHHAVQETDISPGPLDWSRAEVSWPPAGCGEDVSLQVRAWVKQTREGKQVESPVDADLVSGTLLLGGQSIMVDGGEASLSFASTGEPPSGSFTPRGAAAAVPTKIWEPQQLVAGEGWRSPRATFTGSAFYVLGPMQGGQPQFFFGEAPAALLWIGNCGAGFLAPMLPGREYEVALKISGAEAARGKMNLISVTYRMATPPTVMKGKTSNFGVDLMGLENLAPLTQGRPVIVTTIVNNTPAILGDLKSPTRGAKVTGETIVYSIGADNVDARGGAHLDGSGRGRQAGEFLLGVEHKLDSSLQEPRTAMAAVAATSQSLSPTR